MSLYNIRSHRVLPVIPAPRGLRIEECTNLDFLSFIGTTSPDVIRKRLANDHIAYVAYLNNEPAAFGWMAKGSAFIGELNHEMILPARNRYLWNFRTMEKFRGLGIYPVLLQFMINNEKVNADLFWIIHAPENNSSLRGIQKAGFSYAGKLYTDRATATIENTPVSRQYAAELAEMDIFISEQEPASCWNCSSPWLKNRNPDCCCNKRDEECVRHEFLNVPAPAID